MAVYRPIPTNPYEQFRYSLEKECPRAGYWLESMVFGLLAQLDGMTEDAALEIACKIVLKAKSKEPANPSGLHSVMTAR